MSRVLCLCLVVGLVALASAAGAAQNVRSVGFGNGVMVPSPDANPCPGSDLLMNADGSFENGYAWQYGGVVAPYYGAFAEGYEASGTACGIQLCLTALSGQFQNQAFDAYIWAGTNDNPGAVLSVTTNLHTSPPGIWPNITTHDVDITDAGVNGLFFAGYWGNWPGLYSGWFCAVDYDGFGGMPRTNIAPGIGYPTGWNDPSVVWGPTQAMGIGVYVNAGDPSPSKQGTWGWLKRLFN